MRGWQAYHCSENDYSFVFWEGLDGGAEGDFLKRRVGQMAAYEVETRVMDLINGPRSIGICLGYTCQKRANFFPFLLRDGKRSLVFPLTNNKILYIYIHTHIYIILLFNKGRHYRIYTTSTPYQNSVMYSLRPNPTSTSLVCIHFGILTRMDVYNDADEYVVPINADVAGDRITYRRYTTHDEGLDTLVATGIHAANYYSHEYKEVCVLMKGEGNHGLVW